VPPAELGREAALRGSIPEARPGATVLDAAGCSNAHLLDGNYHLPLPKDEIGMLSFRWDRLELRRERCDL